MVTVEMSQHENYYQFVCLFACGALSLPVDSHYIAISSSSFFLLFAIHCRQISHKELQRSKQRGLELLKCHCYLHTELKSLVFLSFSVGQLIYLRFECFLDFTASFVLFLSFFSNSSSYILTHLESIFVSCFAYFLKNFEF